MIQAIAVSTSTLRISSALPATATAMSASARVRCAFRLAGLGMSCETPTRTQVKLSREGWKASGPEIGKLSTPNDSLGSGSAPAALRAARLASTPSVVAWSDGAACARAIAFSKVIGPACAGDAMAALASSAAANMAAFLILLAASGTATAARTYIILVVLDLSSAVDVAACCSREQTESGCQIRKLGGSGSGP